MATKQPKKLKSYYAVDGQGQPVFGKGAALKKLHNQKTAKRSEKTKPPIHRGLLIKICLLVPTYQNPTQG